MIRPAVGALARRAEPDELPCYVYDLAALRSGVRAVRDALPNGVELYYAVKANPEARLLAVLDEAVDGYEVSSGGELTHLRAVLPDAQLAFGGPGKTPAEIAAALRAGVGRFHVESVSELRSLAAEARRQDRSADLLLRVNIPMADATLSGVPLAMGGGPSPFGLDPDDLDACLAVLAGPPAAGRLRMRGLHAHLASGLPAAGQAEVARRVVAFARRLAGRPGAVLEEVNLGGGMAVDYRDPPARFDWARFGAALGELGERNPGLRLRIEPGRSLTAYCGWYVTEVLDVKAVHGAEFAVLRGGTHHLRTPVTKGHDQPFAVLASDDWPHPWPRPRVRCGRVSLVGQLCTPKDVFARDVPVPGGVLRAGDRVAFAMAGAYAWNISHHDFLMHPPPRFHFVD